MKRVITHIIDSTKLLLAIMVSFIYKIFNKDKIYLIGERKDQCQDNGYHLFKYVRENHKNDRFYYCITKDSNQLNKIKGLGNIVYYKSFKHYLYYVLSDKLVCAHVGSCTPDSAIVWKIEEKKVIIKNRIFIQHGITKELIPSLMKKGSNITTFICGAKPEYEFVKNEFGYLNDNVRYLGFCRFDSLHNYKCKNQIVVMPTWRQWFGMDGNNEMSPNEFVSSEYFIAYNNLINSKEINSILEEIDMEMIFYPHNEMQRYIKFFTSKFERIKIADKNQFDVQSLLKESTLLITDYSSVAFDFAYMKKKVIYYQFDKEKYNNMHYQKGYFEYEKNGFGPVIKKEKDLLIYLEKVLKNKADIEQYTIRSQKFFEIYDIKNSERTYNVIKKI